MNIENQQFVERKIASGSFSSQEQVVEEALRRWRENDDGDLHEKIRVGVDDLDSGRSSPLDIEAVKERIRAESGA